MADANVSRGSSALKRTKGGTLTGHKKLIAALADGLNEYADQVAGKMVLLSRLPSSPIWWFANLAIDCGAAYWDEAGTAQLSERTLHLIDLLGIEDFDKDDLWCTCHEDALKFVTPDLLVVPHWWKGRTYEPCWSCLFQVHDRCGSGMCGGRSGEIHFPETVLVKRERVAA